MKPGSSTFSLVGNPGGYFKLTDGKLTLAKALDYEKKQSHTITIQAKDSTGQTTTKSIAIDVGDILESKAGTARNHTPVGKIGRDRLSGGAGNDKLLGKGGDDRLYGGSGNDWLTGGLGADDLWGGSGADRFIFKSIEETTVSASGRDTIFDFSTRQKDKIDLSAIDANTTRGGNQAFDVVGARAFSGQAGELRYEKTATGDPPGLTGWACMEGGRSPGRRRAAPAGPAPRRPRRRARRPESRRRRPRWRSRG